MAYGFGRRRRAGKKNPIEIQTFLESHIRYGFHGTNPGTCGIGRVSPFPEVQFQSRFGLADGQSVLQQATLRT